MTDQETSLQNAFVTQLTAEMGPTDLTAFVVSIGDLTTPCYLVIDMDDDDLREYILFDGTFGASSFVTTNSDRRYQAGSAAPSNLTHAAGATVQSIATQQHFEDLNDRIDADAAIVAALDATVSSLDHGADLAGLDGDDHSQYHNDERGDARYVQKEEYSSVASAAITATLTNPVLGYSKNVVRYIRQGQVVTVNGYFIVSSVSSVGSGSYAVAIPITEAGEIGYGAIGTATVYLSGTTQQFTCIAFLLGGNITFVWQTSTGYEEIWNATDRPMEVGDKVTFSVVYEAS